MRIYAPEPATASTRSGPAGTCGCCSPTSTTTWSTSAPPAPGAAQPFIVLAEADTWLRVEYTGGRAPIARQLGLEEFDFGVYQGWAPAHEVTDLYEHRV